jgi:hypothetical protein
MSAPDPRQAGQQEGERRMDAVHSLLEVHRDVFIRRARRALLAQPLFIGTATADDIAERIGSTPEGIDPRRRGSVPRSLALAGIIRDAGRTAKSSRPEAHAWMLTVWELADRAAALAWLAHNPELPDPEPDEDAGQPCPEPPTTPTPAPLATTAVSQPTLF